MTSNEHRSFSALVNAIKEIPIKYPAVLSGYIIYSYLFLTIIRFYVLAQNEQLSLYEIIELFDALPFLWLLAVALVKVIEIRSKFHESETTRILQEKELDLKETQLRTMHEVVMGLQHHINNPLAVMTITIQKIKRTLQLSEELSVQLNIIEQNAGRIATALKDFSTSEVYTVENLGPKIGAMAIPPPSQPVQK